MRPLLPLLPLLGGLAACLPKGLPSPETHAGPRDRVDVAMPDGVALDTHVFLPKGEGPWPVIFLRAPYPMGPVLDGRCRIFNRFGYACAWQSVRGRGRSEGQWLPFENEPADGKAALEWVADQPWCDGNIGLMGESYLGAVQWAVAEDLPPEVKTIVPNVIGTSLYEAAYEGGLFRHEIVTAWMVLMPERDFRLVSGDRHLRRALRHRPRLELDVAGTGRELPWFREWVQADAPDAPYWQREISQRGLHASERVGIPVLTIGGWSDAFVGPQVETWEALATRSDSTLIVGPWNHLGFLSNDVKQPRIDDGIGLAENYVQWPRLLDWMDHHLKGEPLVHDTRGQVLTFAINGDGWQVRDAWPPPSEPVTLALGPGDDPQRCTGALGEPASGEVRYTYDPEDPTPARGGAGLLAGVLPFWRATPVGFIDQRRLCERRDDLVGFRSAPLDQDLHVAGTLTATLRFASDAEDSAVNVRFLEERPNGDRIMVRESIVALSRRDGPTPGPYTPGEVVTVPLETWPVEYVFEQGSRVVVQVASASFPKYEAHANVAGPWWSAAETRVAQQRLVLEGSSVTLPRVREGAGAR